MACRVDPGRALVVIGEKVNLRQTLLFPVTLPAGIVVQLLPFRYCTSQAGTARTIVHTGTENVTMTSSVGAPVERRCSTTTDGLLFKHEVESECSLSAIGK